MNTPYSRLVTWAAFAVYREGASASETVFVLARPISKPFMRRFRERRFTLP